MTEAEYQKLVDALSGHNVSLTDESGNFRSTYDIMADIAKIWDDLNSTDQAGLANAIAGTRQQSVFYGMIQNFKEASGAMDSMKNSSGALDTAYSTYLDSAQAKIDQFQAKFQSLSSNIMNSDLIKFVVDAGSQIISVIDGIESKVGGLGTLIPGIITSIMASSAGLNDKIKSSFLANFSKDGGVKGGSENKLKLSDILGGTFDADMDKIGTAFEELKALDDELSQSGKSVGSDDIEAKLGKMSNGAAEYAKQVGVANLNVEEFREQTYNSRVSLQAQDKSFKNARSMFNIYYKELADDTDAQEKFRKAAAQTNPTLAKTMKTTKDGSKAMFNYGVNLATATAKEIGLAVASEALSAAISMGVTLAIQDNNNLETRYRLRRELIHALNHHH